MSDDKYYREKQAPEARIQSANTELGNPRRITLREHISGQIDYYLAQIERLRNQAKHTPAALLDSALEDVKDAARLT